jgi:glycosyltransferase involved in cell wall biosynthesis
MIIGFYGAIANNTYVAAKSFQNQGSQVVYLKELGDSFPFSQLVWEDKEFVLDYEQINASKWSEDRWRSKENDLGWKRPAFVKSPLIRVERGIQKPSNGLLEYFIRKYFFLRRKHSQAVLNVMQQADVWIVCGMEATLLAWASGKPYVIWPHGSDIRFAAGIDFSWKNFLGRRVFNEIKRWFLRFAYKNALFIGSHDPSGIGGHVGQVNFSITYFPLPLPLKYSVISYQEKQRALIELFDRYAVRLPKGKLFIFIPSRIDYYWKGTDRLIAAIKSMPLPNLHFIFAGWGQDYIKASRDLNNYGVTFLPFSMSKSFLYKVYQNVSLVVDQFCLGSYGTSALEAMSVGTPVMMYIDNKVFFRKGWLPPPVINVQSSAEIGGVLQKINNDCFSLIHYSEKTVDWFKKTHDEIVSVPLIINKINLALK